MVHLLMMLMPPGGSSRRKKDEEYQLQVDIKETMTESAKTTFQIAVSAMTFQMTLSVIQ